MKKATIAVMITACAAPYAAMWPQSGTYDNV